MHKKITIYLFLILMFALAACSPAMAEHVLATCPTAKASWYDDVGHAPHLEEPERFNRELAELTRRAQG